ncbi:AAA family ATPase, partial [Dolichospermum sp. ST_sed1]|nr:AAA family ATPase [Dolichospermum sp. ST_sed1]
MKFKKLTIENFKSIQSPIEINFRPITLLFGPNSAGKSSILHALLAFREVLHNRNADPQAVLGGGETLNLGGFKTLVNEHDLDRTISIRVYLSMDDDDGIRDNSLVSDLIEKSELFEMIRLQSAMEIKSVFVELGLSFDIGELQPFVSKYV